MEGSYSFTIKTHVLGKRLADEQGETLFDEVSDWPNVFFKATTGKALISRVEEGNQTVFFHDLRDLLPLFSCRIDTSRVVSAGVKQND